MKQPAERRDLTPAFWAELSRLLPPSPVIFDLGAHGMEEAEILLPQLSGRAVWHSFEANPECCASIRRHSLAFLQDRADIILNEVAVSSTVGTATLYRSRKVDGQPWTPSSSIRKPKRATEQFPWMAFDDGIVVPTTTLDLYCQQHGVEHINLVKMDIQGAEVDAIRGGLLTFARTDYVLTEIGCCEEYEGQLGLEGLLDELPGKWELMEWLLGDALLRNVTIP